MQVSIQSISPTINRRKALTNWILADLPSQAEVLEVGAGGGRWDYPAAIAAQAHLIGVDPDPDVYDNPYLHDRYQMTLESFAQGGQYQFDAIYSHMVLEHVDDPLAFVSAAWKLLKPGGALALLQIWFITSVSYPIWSLVENSQLQARLSRLSLQRAARFSLHNLATTTLSAYQEAKFSNHGKAVKD
jgi:SAM-dependent methyltransferase